jgi:phosphoribosylamine-glycine ligase
MIENSRKVLKMNKSGLRLVRLACTEEIKKNVKISQEEKNQKLMQNLLQNHYPLSPPEHQKLSEEIDREKEINQVLKWTEKLEKTFE